jgi:hypothetical protein
MPVVWACGAPRRQVMRKSAALLIIIGIQRTAKREQERYEPYLDDKTGLGSVSCVD